MPRDTAARPFTPFQARVFRAVTRAISRANVWSFRLTGGRVGGTFRYGSPVLLLTTVGRRSGRRRTLPLIYLEDGERLAVVASQAGMPTHPLWYHNLRANPDVEVQIGSEVRKMTARTTSDEEKQAYWPRLTEIYPDYDDYQARTTRDIPVVVLSPR
jgi:deazaflavin-dependent oxidoreductase (nitroreductase family)